MQSLELFVYLLLSPAFEASPAAVGVARDDFKSVFGECVNNFLLAYVDYAGGDEHGVVRHEIGHGLAEHDYDIGNNVCNDYVEFAADLVCEVAVDEFQTVVAEAVHFAVFLRSLDRELVYVNAGCTICAEQERGYSEYAAPAADIENLFAALDIFLKCLKAETGRLMAASAEREPGLKM